MMQQMKAMHRTLGHPGANVIRLGVTGERKATFREVREPRQN